MISETMNNWLIDHFGGFTYAYENENYPFLLQDFTDEEVTKEVTQHGVTEWEDLRKILLDSTKDEEVIAHLWGDTNAETRRESIRQVREMQARMKG